MESRLGGYDPSVAPDASNTQIQEADDAPDIDPEADRRGLRLSGWYFLAATAVILVLTLPPGAPLRDPETGSVIGTSPFMNSLIVIISCCSWRPASATAAVRAQSGATTR